MHGWGFFFKHCNIAGVFNDPALKQIIEQIRITAIRTYGSPYYFKKNIVDSLTNTRLS